MLLRWLWSWGSYITPEQRQIVPVVRWIARAGYKVGYIAGGLESERYIDQTEVGVVYIMTGTSGTRWIARLLTNTRSV